MPLIRQARVPFLIAAAVTATADLASKWVAVENPTLFGPGVIYNPDMPTMTTRLVLVTLTIAVVAALSTLAARRGVGAVPVVWVATGVLVGAVLAQGTSGIIWEQGVPDFIWHGDWVWNLADFAIGIGGLLLFVALLVYPTVAYVRSMTRRRRNEETEGP